jgi:hypothetical protein
MKTCCNCKQSLELDKFYNDKSSKDGKSSRCKSCKDGGKKGKISKKSSKKEKVWTPIPYREHKVKTREERHEYARRQAAMWI